MKIVIDMNKPQALSSIHANASDGCVEFQNTGEFIAKFTLTYQLYNEVVKRSITLMEGCSKSYAIPATATQINMQGQFLKYSWQLASGWTLTHHWQELFALSFERSLQRTIRTWGTMTQQHWTQDPADTNFCIY